MLHKLITRIFATILALWIADYFLGGFAVLGGFKGYLIAGTSLGGLNLLVRPIIKLVTLPLIILTLGLFTVVINAAMLWLAADLTGLISITNVSSLLWATLIVSLVNLN